MSSNTLNNRSSGQTILDTFFNDIHSALDGDMIGRDSSGIPSAGQNLGTAAIPWGTIRASTLVLNGSAIDTSKIVSPTNRVISGKKRSTSNQPAFLTPNGAAASFILSALATNLLVDINGTPVTINTNITKGSLTTAPSSNNTALVNDTEAAGQEDTRLWGEPEHRKVITIDAVGSSISALVGKYAAFKIGTEYFIALVESSTVLSRARRGYYYDSSLNPLNRQKFSDNDTITLMKIGWVFVDSDTTTVDVAYTTPTWSFTAPNSPATGDYWYDLANRLWKRFDGASFQLVTRTIVGQVIMDNTNCVAARCEPFFAEYKDSNTMEVEVSTTEILSAQKQNAKVSVEGSDIDYSYSRPTWNITTDLAGSEDLYHSTEQASTLYYLYVKDDGKTVISDISPYYRDDMLGQYHPHNPWRCVGSAYNDGSSNLTVAAGRTRDTQHETFLQDGNGYGATNTSIRRFTNVYRNTSPALLYLDDANLGATFTCTEPGKYGIQYGEAWASSTVEPTVTVNGDPTMAAVQADNLFGLCVLSTSNRFAVPQSGQVYLKIGDVVRAHEANASGGNNGAFEGVLFRTNKLN
jgi:hypothetical protein